MNFHLHRLRRRKLKDYYYKCLREEKIKNKKCKKKEKGREKVDNLEKKETEKNDKDNSVANGTKHMVIIKEEIDLKIDIIDDQFSEKT